MDSARKNTLSTDTKQNFAISKAKPTLFQPINMKTVKVDSFVKAYQVASLISKPGEPYQTT